jgi:A/G-specific adenine glycosylase
LIQAKKIFSKKILEWYSVNRRELPWRRTKDPYKIWVSEIILQQTRVDQGLPYYLKFTKAFPDVKRLAASKQEEVLRLWQGLGYYSRARNMHRCAVQVVELFGGKFPTQASDLKKLPGIGDYTAAAISSICFGEKSAVVDGNVYRVLSRVFGISTPINSNAGKIAFREIADALIPENFPGDYNQALMEFGALQCTPRNPDCISCPLARICQAKKESIQQLLPVKLTAAPKKERYFNYVLIEQKGKIWLKKRGSGDIWQGLYDFLLIESDRNLSEKKLIKSLDSNYKLSGSLRLLHRLTHLLTHQKLHTSFYHLIDAASIFKTKHHAGMFYSRNQIKKLPKPVFIEKIIDLIP